MNVLSGSLKHKVNGLPNEMREFQFRGIGLSASTEKGLLLCSNVKWHTEKRTLVDAIDIFHSFHSNKCPVV